MNFEEWSRQRKWTLANVCAAAFSFGLSMTIYYPTEYYYFRDTMKVNNPDMYYGLSWAFLGGSGIISSLVGSYYADKTKKVREICLYSSLLNVIGNIMYLLYYSPYVVLFAQLLCGTAAARMVAGIGEISRIYNAEELTQKFAFIGIFQWTGQLLGPCSTYLSKFVDTHVGDWKLNIGNMVGIVMAAIYLLQLLLNLLTLKNLSKEYNLKRDGTKGLLCDTASEDENESPETGEKLNEKPQLDEASFQSKYLTAMMTFRRNKQVLFLYGLAFLTTYLRAVMMLLQPIKSSYYLNWTQTNLAMFYIVSTAFGAIPSILLLSALSKVVKDFYFLVYTLATLILALISMLLFSIRWENHTHTMASVFLYANGVITLMSAAGSHIVFRSMLAKMVPETIQTVTEAIRNSLFELAFMVAGLCLKLPATYMPQFMVISAVVVVIALIWLLFNGEPYKNIKSISPDKYTG